MWPHLTFKNDMFSFFCLTAGYTQHSNARPQQRSFQGCMQMIHIDDHLADLRAVEQGLIGTFENVSLDMCAIIDRCDKFKIVKSFLVPHSKYCWFCVYIAWVPFLSLSSGVFPITVSMVVAVPRHGIHSPAIAVELDTLELLATPVMHTHIHTHTFNLTSHRPSAEFCGISPLQHCISSPVRSTSTRESLQAHTGSTQMAADLLPRSE